LGQGAPAQVTVPQVLNDDYLTVDGERIEIRELNTPNAYLWLPQTKTALGGVLVTAGQHVWMADSQTPAARAEWVAALNRLLALSPERVIPGHFLGQVPSGTDG
ncbi:MAG: MBL fold metallo-hydrolase, partial [Plesiomonas shigelloides]